jgi:hypothetical protein
MGGGGWPTQGCPIHDSHLVMSGVGEAQVLKKVEFTVARLPKGNHPNPQSQIGTPTPLIAKNAMNGAPIPSLR